MTRQPTRRQRAKKPSRREGKDCTEIDEGTNQEKKKTTSTNGPAGHSKESVGRKSPSVATSSMMGKPKGSGEGPEEEETQKQKQSARPPKAQKNSKQKAKSTTAPEVENAIAKFVDNVTEKGVEGLYKEFDDLKGYLPPDYVYEAFTKYKSKNRFPDVVCLDATRVVLKTDYGNYSADDGDYIHANWINIDGLERKFIAAQGPLPNTIEDFWRMVFQEAVVTIIVVCKFVENDQPKCAEYWPVAASSYANYGKMFVNNKKVEVEDKFGTYTLEVLPEGCSNSHVCKLVHVTNWPDKGVPSSGRMVLRLMKIVKESGPGPCIVHCSAGIGRTGTILAIEAINTRLFKGKETSVKDVFTQLRNQRASCIQTEAQYLFIYSTVLDYIKAKLPQKYSAVVTKFYNDLEKL